MSNLLMHAKRELALVGYKPVDEFTEEEPDKWVQEQILELVDVFAKQGHSGMSAPYVLGMFFKLASFEPLKPLTGEDSEWEKVDFQTWQNIRCSRVFKQVDKNDEDNGGFWFYDSQGRVFEAQDGARFTNQKSLTPITFPYMPTTEIVKVAE